MIIDGINRHVDFQIVKVLIIASPGFVKDAFYKHLFEVAVKSGNRQLLDNKAKILLAHSSNGYKHALQEVLQDDGIMRQLSDTKYAKELQAMQEFYKVLSADPCRAFYGYEYVIKAADQGAVKTLMITDTLFRANDVKERKKYIALVQKVQENGGDFMILSSLHTSGEQLSQLTGVAALLHFPMPDLEEEVELEMEKQAGLIQL